MSDSYHALYWASLLGKKVGRLSKAKPGDIICYSGHVAIYMGGNKIAAFTLVQQLRAAGIRADMDHTGRSLKAQFKYANKTGAPLCITLGDDEGANGVVKIKNMNTREERTVPNAEAAAAAKSFLAAKWQAMTSALSAFRNSAIAATIATKAQAVAEMALSAKTAVINGWLAMTSALKGMTLASIGAKIALKAQAAVEMAMGAKTAILNGLPFFYGKLKRSAYS